MTVVGHASEVEGIARGGVRIDFGEGRVLEPPMGPAGLSARTPAEAGARGAVDAGLVPGLLPGGRPLDDAGDVARVWGGVPTATGMDTRAMLDAARDGRIKALVLVGADPVADAEDPELAAAALSAVDHVVALDLLPTATVAHVDVVLPACAAQERTGSFTTWEGRRQPFVQVVPPQALCLPDWDALRQVARAMGTDLGWESADDVRREAAPLMAPVRGTDATAALRAVAPGATPPREVSDDGWLDAVVVDLLVGDGTMLAGADELLAARDPATVRVNARDAEALGVVDGGTVEVVGQDPETGEAAGEALRVRSVAVEGVAPGTVVLTGGMLAHLPGAAGRAEGTWLRVRLSEPAAAGGEPAPLVLTPA